MKCTQCSKYSYSLRRCLLGKANPKTRKEVLNTARLFGPSYICSQNKWIEKIREELITELERRAQS